MPHPILYKLISLFVSLGILIQPFSQNYVVPNVSNATTLSPQQKIGDTLDGPGPNQDLAAILEDTLSPEEVQELKRTGLLLPNGMPHNSLVDHDLFQAIPSAIDAPLLLARTQSTYVPAGLVSSTLVVTLTVTNRLSPAELPELTGTNLLDTIAQSDFSNDPNVIKNVVLSDVLLPANATLLSASKTPDTNGNNFAWNLGNIEPQESITLTLQISVVGDTENFLQLDEGALVFGSLQGSPVSTSVTPATLAPNNFGNWLQWTIDADYYDSYVIKTAAELGNDPNRMFEFVRSLGYDSYKGSLRGARGTLWTEAGNSLDQASLLIAMLRGSGVPARYLQGPLDLTTTQSLLVSMFEIPAGLQGQIPSDTPLSDPINDPQLIDETEDHWWVQAYIDGQWVDLDPSFEQAVPGQVFATSVTNTYIEVPDNLRHKVTARLKVEEYHPLNIGGSSPGLSYSYPLVHTFNAVELVGRPVTFQQAVNTNSQGGAVFYYTQNTYTPYLFVNDFDKSYRIEGNTFQEVTSNFPFGTFTVTAEWLIFDFRDVDGQITTQTREIFDIVGYENRQAGGTLALDVSGQTTKITEFDAITAYISPSRTSREFLRSTLSQFLVSLDEARDMMDEFSPILDNLDGSAAQEITLRPLNEKSHETIRYYHAAKLVIYAAVDDKITDIGDGLLVHTYSDAPRIVLASTTAEYGEDEVTSHDSFDLLNNFYRVVAAPGQAADTSISFQVMLGMAQTSAENVVHEMYFGIKGAGTVTILNAAQAQGIELIALSMDNLEELETLDISPEAKARITADVRNGNVILTPRSMVEYDGRQTIAWWRIDTETGRTVGVLENGQHGLYEWAVTNFATLVVGLFLAGFFTALLARIVNSICAQASEGAGSFACFIITLLVSAVIDQQAIELGAILSFVIADIREAFNQVRGMPPGWPMLIAIMAVILLLAVVLGIILGWCLIDWLRGLGCEAPQASSQGLSPWVRAKGNLAKLLNQSDTDPPIQFTWGITGTSVFSGTTPPDSIAPLASGLIDTTAIEPVTIARAEALYQGVPSLANGLLTVDMNTAHSYVQGRFVSQWQTDAVINAQYTSFYVDSATVRDADGQLVATGMVTAAVTLPDSITLTGTNLNYETEISEGSLSTYAPIFNGMGIGTEWSSYDVTVSATSFISSSIQPQSLLVDSTPYPAADYFIELNSPIRLQGHGPGIAPSFASQWQADVITASVQVSPGTGTAVFGSSVLDVQEGIAVAGFTGSITVTEQTSTTDHLQLRGYVDQLSQLNISPASLSTTPFQSVTFQIDVVSNITDTYRLEVVGPNGWDVTVGNDGLVVATPGIGVADPDDYTFFISAQSQTRPTFTAAGKQIITLLPAQGVGVDIGQDERVTVPLGSPTSNSADNSLTNNGQLQLPDAAFVTTITNTSTVSHTFAVQLTGLPQEWVVFNGAAEQIDTTLTLPAGGISKVGLYIVPTLPLPAPGTNYSFNVTATAVDNPSLTQTDTDVFTIPAIAFNYVTANPTTVYVSPDTAATFDIAVQNVGNTPGTFPITLTLPISTWISSYANSTGPLTAGATHNQTVTFTPLGAAVGDDRQIRVNSPAPNTAYVQKTFVRVAVRDPEVVCAYHAVLAAPAADPGLAAALDNLLTQLELWSDLGNLSQRDRTVTAIQEVVTQLSAYPGLAVTNQFSDIATQMSTHTASTDLAADRSALGNILCLDLQPVLALITAYNPSLSIFPGILATVPGRTVTPTLSVANYGDMPATAVFSLSDTPAGWDVITPTQVSLQPGVAQQIPLPVTANALGTDDFSITMHLLEAPALAITRTVTVRVVSELLNITEVALNPNFLNVGTGTTEVSIRLANLAGLRANTTANVQLTDATGTVRKTLATPFTVAVNNSGPFLLGALDIDGLEQGVYTATVRLLDPDGSLIPNATGSTFLAIGQDLEVTYDWSPVQVAPGQPGITVTTVITTRRTDVPTTTVPFTPTVKWFQSTFSAPTNYNQVVSLPAVGDINLDGIPDVVFAAYRPGNPNSDGVLRVISGDDGSELFSVSNSSWRVMPLSSPIIVDLENDGIPEIVAERNVGGLIAFDNTGTAKYISTAFMNPTYGSLPVVADTNDDGLPEIIVGRFVVNNTLSTVTSLGGGPGGGTDAALTSIVGDVNLDGTFEVIAGNTIYSSAGGILAQNATIPTITTLGLGNFDNDPEAEIVVVDPFGSRVFLVDHQMNIIWGPVAIPLTGSAAFGNGGTPTVADFDGDGAVEIGIAGASDYVVYDTNGTILWQDPNVNDSSSGVTGSSVFDFQGDGQAEVVYADQQYLKVYNGADGTILFQRDHSSSTAFELPVIADVDADGHAEIIVSQNNDFTGSFTGIRVFEAEDDSWVSTRQLWYQQAYDLTSLTDNARVVTNPTPVWLLYNTFRSQASTPTQGDAYFIDTRHGLPLTGALLLTDTVAPLPLDLTADEIHWLYSQQDREETKVSQLSQQILPALQPGEIRQISTGTVISYTRNDNNTVLLLPPLYVSAPHLITITPDSQVASPNTAVPYTVTLTNAFSTTQVMNLTVLGIPANWVSLADTVTLNSGETVQLPLVVTVPADVSTQDNEFMVQVSLAAGGEDVTSAVLAIRPGPQLHLSPPLQFVPYGEIVTYGFTLTNTTSQAEQYTFTTTGLEGLPVDLPADANLAAGESFTGVLTVTAQTAERTIPFQVVATGLSGLSADAEAGLGLLNGPAVTAQLSPAIALAGRGTPARYVVTVTNTGSVEDDYSFSANLPPGWTYQLVANGLPVDTLRLTPFVFNSADLQLLVTPAVTTTPASYPVQLVVVSESDAETSATAVAQAQVVSQGVQLDVSPASVTMSPIGSQTWDVTVTNTGEAADTFTLHAGGIVSATAQFVPASVSLSPGAATVVQLTAANLDFALPRTYPFAVTAHSTSNPAIFNTDDAEVTFSGFEAVSVSITPTIKVVDGFTGEHQFFMVFTNTGNIGTIYNLSGSVSPTATMTFEADQVYVPAHMTAGVLVTLLVPSAGTYNITVQADSTSSTATDTATATLIINTLNTPPVAADDSATTPENVSVTIFVLANDSDVDGDTLIVSAVTTPTNGTVVNNGSDVVYTPNLNFSGSDSFTYTVSDSNGGVDTATVTVMVIPVNDPPTAVDDTAVTAEDTAVTIPVLTNDSDGEGDTLSVSAITQPVNGTVVNNGVDVTYTPGNNFSGSDSFTYTVSDGNGGSDTAVVTVTVTPVNDTPLAVADTMTTTEDTAVVINVLANDSDVDGDTLTVNTVTQPGNGLVVINPDNTVTYTPDPDFNSTDTLNGTDTFTYTVSDGNGAQAAALVTITVIPVNDAPIATDDAATVPEDSSITVAVLTNDSDVDGDPLTVTSVSNPAQGTAVVNTDNTVTYTPTVNFNGTDSFAYTISDGQGGSGTAVVVITITPVNDAPVANDDTAVVAEDAAVTVDVLANDTDVDGDSLVVTEVITPAHGMAVINPDNTITYTPAANFNGSDSFTYTASDGNGGAATAVVTVTVTSLNDLPVAADDSASTAEDVPVLVDVLANDADIDGDVLAVTAVTQPTNGTAAINGDDTVTYTPNGDFNGSDSFSYTVEDGNGGSDTAMVTVAVSAVNDAPQAVDDAATTAEDTAVTIDVLANDTDVDGDPLTVTAVTTPTHGTAVVEVDGTVTYTPAPDYYGSDSFSYTVGDGQGATDTATVTITITPVNDAPIANDDAVVTAEDTAVTIDVLNNDADDDGDSLSVSGITPPPVGTAVINADNTVTYTPPTEFNGVTSFTYTVSDGNGGTATATVTVTVTGENDNPVAVDDSATTLEDTAVIMDVLANDTDNDGDILSVSGVTQPVNGTVTINADNSVTYTPEANFFGNDSFTYTISDGQGGSDTATVTVTITAVNDDPAAGADSATTAEDTAVIIGVLANDTDVDGDALTVTAVTTPTNGTAILNADDTITYMPGPDFYGSDSFTYTLSDGQGGQDTAMVSVIVMPVNDAPVAVDDQRTTPEDTAVIINVLANDSDVDGDSLVVTSVVSPTNGTVVVNANDTITYAPAANYHGSDSFSYTISDGNGGSDTATVTLTITAVNDAPIANDDNATTLEDTAVTIDVLANDSDIEGDSLVVSAVTEAGNGSVIINADNSVTYLPDPDFNLNDSFDGTDVFTYTVSDGNGGSDMALVTIIVTPVNDPPVAADDNAAADEDTAVTIEVLANDLDVDGDVLTVTAVTTPTNGTAILNADNTVTYTPAPDFNGVANFSYTITDGHGGSDTAVVTVAVNPANDPPVAADDNATTPEDTAVTMNLLANDTDVDGDTLIVSDVTTPTQGTVTVNPDNTVTYTPAANYHGSDAFSYTVSDGHGGSDMAVVTITITPVNDAPVANDDSISTAEDTAVTIDVLANDVDIDGDSLVVDSASPPGQGLVTVNADNSITYSPDAGFVGEDSFSYSIIDGQGGTDTAVVTVTVTAENDNPVANDDSATTSEDTAAIVDVLANDTDADGDGLTVASVTQPANGAVVVNPDNTVTYTPAANFYGEDQFSYTISDGHGGSDTALVTVTVTPVNDMPAAVDDSATTPQDTAVIVDVLTNDTDVDGDVLNVESVTQPAHGLATINGDGSITYTPDAGYSGTDTFTYTVSDGHGGTDTATVTIVVTPVSGACNLYPMALHSDSLVGVNVGDILTDIMNGNQPGNFGWLTWTGDNSVPVLAASLTPPGNSHTYINPYDPNDHIVSIDDWVEGKPGVSNAQSVREALDELMTMDITIPVWDAVAGGGANTNYQVSAFVTVRLLGYNLVKQDRLTLQFLGYTTCEAGNTNPTAANDAATVLQNTALTMDVLANDSDLDGDMLTITSLTAPDHGTAVINPDNSITYTPDTGFTGLDSFLYAIGDGQGGSSTATVVISVTPIPTACELYPIALSATTLLNAQTGDTFNDIVNGKLPGQFGWLSWNGVKNGAALAASLTPPGNSHTYINPLDAGDHQVSVGDWVHGKPGASNAQGVRDALAQLQLTGQELIVPVWDMSQGPASGLQYHVSGFARIRLLDYEISKTDVISIQFLGYAACEEQATATESDGWAGHNIDTLVALSDQERWAWRPLEERVLEIF